jgi:RNA polymerase sigma-70 factor (ECF subfamily)
MAKEGRFDTTRWSVVLAAQARGEPGSREALAYLCEAYWYPLYFFVRRSGHGPDQALDLTQEFFLRLVERNWLESVRPEAGRFRSFLLATMKHFLANEARREGRLKRGGDRVVVSLDGEAAEGRYRLEPQGDESPEREYERRWALAVLDRARARLASEMAGDGKERQHGLLEPYLSGEEGERPYRETAALLETSEASVKMAVMRLRRRFGRLVREEIARTVGDDAEVGEEVRHLLTVVR